MGAEKSGRNDETAVRRARKIESGASSVGVLRSQRVAFPVGGSGGLRTYQTAEIVHDATVAFCSRFPNRGISGREVAVQTARKIRQNVGEGELTSGISRQAELRLIGAARAGLQELRQFYEDFLHGRNLSLWERNHPRAQEIRKLAFAPNRSYSTTYEPLIAKDTDEIAANAVLCLLHQLNYLLEQELRQLERRVWAEGLQSDAEAMDPLFRAAESGPRPGKAGRAMGSG